MMFKMSTIWKTLLLLLAFLSFGAASYFYFSSKAIQSTDNIIFLSNDETQDVLNNDADHYYQTFHSVDLKVRKSKNLQEYLGKISKSGCEGMEENKEKIVDCIEKVKKKLHSHRNETIEGVNIGVMLDLPWKFGFVCDNYYENGLPHTRGDVIILNNQDIQRRNIQEMCRLLIHEKVHIYQKTKKEDFETSIKDKYEKTKDTRESETAPANPDIDAFTYKRKSDGEIMESKYNETPAHFRDIAFPKGDHTLEHPYETIAYTLESLYS